MPMNPTERNNESPETIPRTEDEPKSSPKPKTNNKSVLIIGVTGRTGLACLRRFSRHNPSERPTLHAFCRDASNLSDRDKELCETISEGDARDEEDIKSALKRSHADVVLVCIGNGGALLNADIRTASANAIVNVMNKKKFKHVRALVISRLGAGTSRICVGLGIGKIMEHSLRFSLKDHTGQEQAFLSSLKDRTTIVRPTSLKYTKATGKMQDFGDHDKPPTLETPIDDLATWLMNEVCCGFPLGGRVANVTGLKI